MSSFATQRQNLIVRVEAYLTVTRKTGAQMCIDAQIPRGTIRTLRDFGLVKQDHIEAIEEALALCQLDGEAQS